MKELLTALGWKITLLQRLRLISLFITVTFSFLIIGHVLRVLFQWNFLLVHAAGWALWFGWQGWLFPRNREKYIHNTPTRSYQKAFYRDILFGVSFGVSQMFSPVFNGYLATSIFSVPFWQSGVGLFIAATGSFFLYLGFRTIGLARAGFLAEFCDLPSPLLENGIYTYIRHPLFLGGVITCVGLSIFFSEPLSLILALINILILPIYQRIEDMRLTRVFGKSYAQYCISTGGIIPKHKQARDTIKKTLGQN